MGADWGDGERHVLLIRDPRDALAEMLPKRTELRAEDLGLPQQNRLFERIVDRTGQPPLIIDAGDFLREPGAHLRALCRWLGIAFHAHMESAHPGAGLPGACTPPALLEGAASELLAECLPMYRRLYQHRLLRDVPQVVGEVAAPH